MNTSEILRRIEEVFFTSFGCTTLASANRTPEKSLTAHEVILKMEGAMQRLRANAENILPSTYRTSLYATKQVPAAYILAEGFWGDGAPKLVMHPSLAKQLEAAC